MPPKEYRYKAFISYSHQDRKWGDWLHRALETYRVPRGLVGKETCHGSVPKRLFPIFRDREELPTSAELGEVINQALEDSSHLIVICSPRSAKSQWVNEEIKEFKRLGKSDQVLCLIVDGEPNAADKPDPGQEECFPEAAKYQVGDDGVLSNVQAEPIAADARDGRDGKRNSLLKVVAGLLGVGFDDIKQRDLARKQKRLAILSSFSFALVAVMAGLTFWALDQQQKAEIQREAAVQAQKEEARQRTEAERQRQEAEIQREATVQAQKAAEQENYYNAIASAQSKINEKQLVQAKRILWATPQAPRNWEWGRLMRLCSLELLSLDKHRESIISVAFSHDGKRLATACLDGTAIIWDADTGKFLLSLVGGHLRGMRSAAFSPDGRLLVTVGNQSGPIKIFDAFTGQEKLAISIPTHQSTSAAFSPDGRRLVMGGYELKARIVDTKTGKELLTIEDANRVSPFPFSPDGRHLVTTNFSKTAKVSDAVNGKQLKILEGHDAEVLCAAFSPDGRRLVTASADNTAKVWDAETGRELLSLDGHDDVVYFAVFSPDGQRVATASDDRTAKVWNAGTGKELHTIIGQMRLTGGWNGNNLKGRRVANSIAFSADGRCLVTANADKTAKIWDAENSGRSVTLAGHKGILHTATFSPDGRRVVTASSDATAKIWDAEYGQVLLALDGVRDNVNSATFSPDGRHVLLALENRDLPAKIWDAESGRPLLELKPRFPADRGAMKYATYSPDGLQVVGVGSRSPARIWDVQTGKELINWGMAGDRTVSFSPDAKRVVTAGWSSGVDIFDARNSAHLLSLRNCPRPRSAFFSPDGHHVLTTASNDTYAIIWDAETGKKLVTMEGHDDGLNFAVFSPDGRRVVTASNDKTAKVWVADTGMELLSLKGHDSGINSVAFSSDGRSVVTSSGDKTAKIWGAEDWSLTKGKFLEQKRRRYSDWVKAHVSKTTEPRQKP